MTTTDTPTAPPDADALKCPNCGREGKQIEGTDVKSCNSCGHTWGDPTEQPDATATDFDGVEGEARDAPSTDVALRDEGNAAMAELPNLPLPGEWEQILAMAVTFSQAGICPKALFRKPNDMALVLWTGRELGIPLTSAMREIYVIEGTTTISPKLKLGRVQMLGLGKIIPDPLAEQSAVTATALALLNIPCLVCTQSSGWLVRDGQDPMPCPACHTTGFKLAGPPHTFDWSDAIAAGLLSAPQEGKEPCTPTKHTCDYRSDGKTKYRCKDNWRHWPKNMHWWRASTQSVDVYFPQAGLGMYTPDDVGAITDINGEIIDVDVVQMWSPQGVVATAGGGYAAPPEVPRATDEQIADLRWRVQVLPKANRDVLLERWTEKVQEGRLEPVQRLLSSHVAIGTALVNGEEANAKKDGWTPPERPEDVVAFMAAQDAERAATRAEADAAQGSAEASQEAPDAPGADAATDAAPEPSEATSEATAASPGQSDEAAPAESPPEGEAEPAADPPPDRLDVQRGKPKPETTNAHVDQAIALVKRMTVRTLNAGLRSRQLATDGPENIRRQNLAREMADELAQADWDDANKAAE